MNYKTYGELLEACYNCQTQKDAEQVIQKALEDSPHAKENIGYLLGYMRPEEREKLYTLFFDCNHPIFGSGFGRGKDISPKEAFEAGQIFAQTMIKNRGSGG